MANGTVPAAGGGASLVTSTARIIFYSEMDGVTRHVNLRLTKYGKIVFMTNDDEKSLPDPSSYDYAINVRINQMYNSRGLIPEGYRPTVPTYAISPAINLTEWNGYEAYWTAWPDGTLSVRSCYNGQQEARFSMTWYTEE